MMWAKCGGVPRRALAAPSHLATTPPCDRTGRMCLPVCVFLLEVCLCACEVWCVVWCGVVLCGVVYHLLPDCLFANQIPT